MLPGEVREDGIYLAGAAAPIESPNGFPPGPVSVYARATDFRVVGEDAAAVSGRVLETQRTGVLLRLTVQLDGGGPVVEIEIPQPDPEIKVWLAGDVIRLRPAHFSLYREKPPLPASIAVDRSADYAAPGSRVRGQ